jgi:hypothetical protein
MICEPSMYSGLTQFGAYALGIEDAFLSKLPLHAHASKEKKLPMEIINWKQKVCQMCNWKYLCT